MNNLRDRVKRIGSLIEAALDALAMLMIVVMPVAVMAGIVLALPKPRLVSGAIAVGAVLLVWGFTRTVAWQRLRPYLRPRTRRGEMWMDVATLLLIVTTVVEGIRDGSMRVTDGPFVVMSIGIAAVLAKIVLSFLDRRAEAEPRLHS